MNPTTQRKTGPSTLAARSAGFSLIEVFIAIGILGFGLLSLAVMQIEALSQGSAGKHSVDAAAVGRTTLEQAHRVPWTVLDAAQAAGTWTNPNWTGAAPTVNVLLTAPGVGALVEHVYGVQWRVTDIGTSSCLRDVEVQVSWTEENLPAAKTLDFATRRYNYGDPSC